MVRRVERALAAVAVVWALAAAVTALRTAWVSPPDSMAALSAEFLELARFLPAGGEVGYLESYRHDGSDTDVRVMYAAQYALVPRVLRASVGPEFLIVARGTDEPNGDARLEGYFLVAGAPDGHRIYRRLRP